MVSYANSTSVYRLSLLLLDAHNKPLNLTTVHSVEMQRLTIPMCDIMLEKNTKCKTVLVIHVANQLLSAGCSV